MADIFGGSYKQCKGNGKEGHHVYFLSAYKNILGITKDEGPSIRMDVKDHRSLLSSGGPPGSVRHKHRQEQRSLLEQEKYREAWYLAVLDIRNNSNIEKNKYDNALTQAEGQLLKLDSDKKIQLDNAFKTELEERQRIQNLLDQHQQEGKIKESANKQAVLQSNYDKNCFNYLNSKKLEEKSNYAKVEEKNTQGKPQSFREKFSSSIDPKNKEKNQPVAPSTSLSKEEKQKKGKQYRSETFKQRVNTALQSPAPAPEKNQQIGRTSISSKPQTNKEKNNHQLGL